MSEPVSPVHAAARAAIARGWAVFPLKARDKIPSIPKSAGGKGCQDATTHPGQIEAWWRQRPDCNLGLATGAESGVWVLDVDGAEGAASLEALEAQHGALPDTVAQITGKGFQYFFRWPATGEDVRNSASSKRLGVGLDVRGFHGYVVLAPSIHPSGRAYAWMRSPDDCAIANAPGWLLELVIPPKPKPAAPVAPRRAEHGRASLYGEKALDSACRRIAGCQPGNQNSTLTSEAASIGELVAGGEIERGYAEPALVNAGLAMACGGKPWLPDQIAKKVAWGMDVGAARARKAPARDPRFAASTPRPSPARRQVIAPHNALWIAPPTDKPATLIVTIAALARVAADAWQAANGGPFGLFVADDVRALVGGMAVNAGGFVDWRLPRPDLARPGLTMRWRGPVFVVIPDQFDSFVVSKGTKFERFISSERQTQVASLLATHWWKQAGASDVRVAALCVEAEEAA